MRIKPTITGRLTRRATVLLGVAYLCSWPTLADTPKQAPSRAPVVWGITSEAKGCVIFREYTKTKVGFYLVVVTTKSHSELEVIESDGYTVEPTKWVEDEAGMNELQRRAVKDQIRYVKVQDKYTPDELEAARAICHASRIGE